MTFECHEDDSKYVINLDDSLNPMVAIATATAFLALGLLSILLFSICWQARKRRKQKAFRLLAKNSDNASEALVQR